LRHLARQSELRSRYVKMVRFHTSIYQIIACDNFQRPSRVAIRMPNNRLSPLKISGQLRKKSWTLRWVRYQIPNRECFLNDATRNRGPIDTLLNDIVVRVEFSPCNRVGYSNALNVSC